MLGIYCYIDKKDDSVVYIGILILNTAKGDEICG